MAVELPVPARVKAVAFCDPDCIVALFAPIAPVEEVDNGENILVKPIFIPVAEVVLAVVEAPVFCKLQ